MNEDQEECRNNDAMARLRNRRSNEAPRLTQTCDPLEAMEKAAAIFRERNETYGENYKHFGHSMVGMFPEGLTLRTVEEWNRIGLIIACVGKLNRYGANFSEGGHADSAQDLAVYAAILRSMTS